MLFDPFRGVHEQKRDHENNDDAGDECECEYEYECDLEKTKTTERKKVATAIAKSPLHLPGPIGASCESVAFKQFTMTTHTTVAVIERGRSLIDSDESKFASFGH